jgi:hypothetical protein
MKMEYIKKHKIMNNQKTVKKATNTPLSNSALNQAEIVKQRLNYHFSDGDGNWNVPKSMPFMKEFLNEVYKLCESVS